MYFFNCQKNQRIVSGFRLKKLISQIHRAENSGLEIAATCRSRVSKHSMHYTFRKSHDVREIGPVLIYSYHAGNGSFVEGSTKEGSRYLHR